MSNDFFHPQSAPPDGEIPPLGGKARALLTLQQTGHFRIPEWFAVLPGAALKTRKMAARSQAALLVALRDFPARTLFAVRSSALPEDGAEPAPAGPPASFLFVTATQVVNRVERLWTSSPGARPRRESAPGLPVVIVQRMIEPETSGVAFAVDPASGRRSRAVVAALWGAGTALAGGDTDRWQVTREGEIVERQIAEKKFADRWHKSALEGVRQTPVAAEYLSRPSLSDEEVLAVAGLARRASAVSGQPQEIAWTFGGGQIYLLQARPITTLAGLPDPDGVLRGWDHSDLAESFGGLSSPLTFSFARRAYAGAWREFGRMGRVPEKRLAENEDTFGHLLGYVRGRIYYNLASWQRVLELLPGSQLHRPLVEQMLGVCDSLPPELATSLSTRPSSRWRGLREWCGSAWSLLLAHRRLPARIEHFERRLGHALAEPQPPLAEMRADQLAVHYRQIEAELLARWDAPLTNDFFATLYFGLLRSMAGKWAGGKNGKDKTGGLLANDLISGQGGLLSAEPAWRLRKMAALAAGDPALVTILQTAPRAEALEALAWHEDLLAEWQAYLERFAERCLEELKLEARPLDEDPLPLLRAIGRLAAAQDDPKTFQPSSQNRSCEQAEATMQQALRGDLPQRLLFEHVLRQARRHVRARETLRFAQTRVFGRVRRIFLHLGQRFAADGQLADARDIFLLGVEEILGFVDGTALSTDLRALVKIRAAEQRAFSEQSAPADRFATRGAVHLGNRFADAASAPEPADHAGSWQGLGCSPGLVRGRARLILDPREATVEAGEILVARHADPGWILLFPAAAGVLLEYGGLLSHAAIVARELGLPAIVSLPHLTSHLKTGDLLEMNGATGLVRKI